MKQHLGKLLLGVALAFGMSVSAHAALLIDDFGALTPPTGINDPGCIACVNPDQGLPDGTNHPSSGNPWSYAVFDGLPPGNGPEVADANPIYNGTTYQNNMVVLRPDPPGPPVEVDNPRNWTRDIEADLTAGESLSAEICYNCQAGHHVSGAAGSNGNTAFIYNAGIPVNANEAGTVNAVMLQYASDQDGAVIRFTFDDGSGSVASVDTDPLPNTGNSNFANYQPISLRLPAGVDYSDLTSARIDIFGVADLDMTIDNFKLVPEPGVLAMLGLGLVGLGFARRRRAS